MAETKIAHKFAVGSGVWFEGPGGKIFAAVVLDARFRHRVEILESREFTTELLHESRLKVWTFEKGQIQTVFSDSPAAPTEFEMDFTPDPMMHIARGDAAKQRGWDLPATPVKLIDTQPIYRVLSQWAENSPSVDEIDSKKNGEPFGGVAEDRLSARTPATK